MYLCSINGSCLISLKAPNGIPPSWDRKLERKSNDFSGLEMGEVLCLQLWSRLISVGPLGCCHVSATISSSSVSLWSLSSNNTRPYQGFQFWDLPPTIQTFTTCSSEALAREFSFLFDCVNHRELLRRSQLSDSLWISSSGGVGSSRLDRSDGCKCRERKLDMRHRPNAMLGMKVELLPQFRPLMRAARLWPFLVQTGDF